MAVTGHFYSRRNRAPTTGSTESARVISATRTGNSPRKKSECNLAIVKKTRNNTTASTLSSQVEAHSSNKKPQKRSVKAKDSKRSRGVSDFQTGLDIEDAPPIAVYRFTEEEASNIRTSLLSWYDENHRILPWRQNIYSRHEQQTGCEADGDVEGGRCPKEEADISCRFVPEDFEQCKVAGKKEITSKSASAIVEEAKNSKQRTMNVGKSTEMEDQRAYEVWVSEMMLQQTRVATVIEYYHRWMERWPTLHHLARASQEEVNTVWAGLGYYRRARFLLEGAKHIEEKGSGFPRSLKELQQVPGIGEYTSGAIASISFQLPVPVVDGNVIRVLSRLRAITENPKLPSTVKIFWALAGELVDFRRPGDLNQSIMELGATVCRPTSPSCSSCPVASQCKALSLQSKSLKVVTDFPLKVAKVKPRNEYVAICVLVVMNGINLEAHVEGNFSSTDSHILLVQRPKQGLLAGLWEFPLVSLGGMAAPCEEQRAAMDRYLKDSLGFNFGDSASFSIQRREDVGTYVHVFSHIRMHMSIEWLLLCPSEGSQWQLKSMARKQAGISMKWVQADAVGKLGLTSGVKKVYSMYLNHLKQRKTPRSKRSRSLL